MERWYRICSVCLSVYGCKDHDGKHPIECGECVRDCNLHKAINKTHGLCETCAYTHEEEDDDV